MPAEFESPLLQTCCKLTPQLLVLFIAALTPVVNATTHHGLHVIDCQSSPILYIVTISPISPHITHGFHKSVPHLEKDVEGRDGHVVKPVNLSVCQGVHMQITAGPQMALTHAGRLVMADAI
jgi:hypothetical protein